jgi:hypothetical protein
MFSSSIIGNCFSLFHYFVSFFLFHKLFFSFLFSIFSSFSFSLLYSLKSKKTIFSIFQRLFSLVGLSFFIKEIITFWLLERIIHFIALRSTSISFWFIFTFCLEVITFCLPGFVFDSQIKSVSKILKFIFRIYQNSDVLFTCSTLVGLCSLLKALSVFTLGFSYWISYQIQISFFTSVCGTSVYH